MRQRITSTLAATSEFCLVHDKQRGSATRDRSMRLGAIRDLIAHARAQPKHATIRELGFEISGHTEQDVALLTPMVGAIVRGVLDHPHADRPEMARPPRCAAALSGVLRGRDLGPIGNAERDIGQVHFDTSFPGSLRPCSVRIRRAKEARRPPWATHSAR